MNSLENATSNSILLIEQRLRALQEEVQSIEEEYGDVGGLEPEPLPSQPPQRYQALPDIAASPAPKPTLKPQITEEYSKTLQYAPSPMTLYDISKQEPEFIKEACVLPPKLKSNENTLDNYILEETFTVN